MYGAIIAFCSRAGVKSLVFDVLYTEPSTYGVYDDEAFGYAVNSLSYPTVATQFNIHFIAAAGSKDRLTAEGRVIRAGKRAVTCEMTVSNQEGKLIAKATGTSIPLGRDE